MWGQAPYYPPMMGYPGQDVRFVPVPANNDEAIKILKKELKELKKKNEGGKKEEKKDDKKPKTYSFLELWALLFTSNVFTFMCSGLFYYMMFRGGR